MKGMQMDRRYREFEDRQALEGMVAEPSPAIAYAERNQQRSKIFNHEEVVRDQINDVLEANAEKEQE